MSTKNPPSVDWADRIALAQSLVSPACRLCPRRCGVDRRRNEIGFCGTGFELYVSSVTPHFGEEAVLVGRGGSGTVFFSGCNLGCVFCQNASLSTAKEGRTLSPDRLAERMIGLERIGCHNVNVVTPTHQVHGLLAALRIARERGLSVPFVYNCGGYETLETLDLLDGVVDIYMPDVKFDDPVTADRLCHAPDYPQVMREALKRMHQQVGDLRIENGLATRGLLVRHLVMPGGAEEGQGLMRFLAEEVSPNTYVNVMGQYRPMHRAYAYPGIDRAPTPDEISAVRETARELGMRGGD